MTRDPSDELDTAAAEEMRNHEHDFEAIPAIEAELGWREIGRFSFAFLRSERVVGYDYRCRICGDPGYPLDEATLARLRGDA